MNVMRQCAGPIVGIDVGENFLDLATVDTAAARVRLARVALVGIEHGGANGASAICELRRRMLAGAPELGTSDAIALIDSPRWPRDLDLAASGTNDIPPQRGREIDASLRAMVKQLELRKRDGGLFRLSLFPTPQFEFFAACVSDPRCKPHLAAIGRELFGAASDRIQAGPAPVGGRIFTRFMIAGFAAYRGIDGLGAESYEAYPDLAFRLWASGVALLPKSAGRAAFDARVQINRRLAEELGCEGASEVRTLDEADAAILALSAARARRVGQIGLIEAAREGRFALAMDSEHVRRSDMGRFDHG
jgi:hypothetical protein